MHIEISIYSIAKIESDARKAAHEFVDLNDACPYPFHSTAGHVFRLEFYAERDRKLMLAAEASCTN